MEDHSSNRSIPVLRNPANIMMVGVNGDNLACSAVTLHPVDRMQKTGSSSRLDLDMIRSIYGSGLAMRLATERRMACQVGGRILGSHESQVMYETVTGMDTTLDFSDFLGRPSDNPEGNALETAHTWMERKLQL
mmetsp:Transcript_3701/g.5541  ORF Transcript_3701/g.5541 Transcript_3701/m.5541 type:complete len:134 (+) Transcript_3701:145-546(+)